MERTGSAARKTDESRGVGADGCGAAGGADRVGYGGVLGGGDRTQAAGCGGGRFGGAGAKESRGVAAVQRDRAGEGGEHRGGVGAGTQARGGGKAGAGLYCGESRYRRDFPAAAGGSAARGGVGDAALEVEADHRTVPGESGRNRGLGDRSEGGDPPGVGSECVGNRAGAQPSVGKCFAERGGCGADAEVAAGGGIFRYPAAGSCDCLGSRVVQLRGEGAALKGEDEVGAVGQRFAALDERPAEGFEIEGAVVGVQQVAAPEFQPHEVVAEGDFGVQKAVKVLPDVVRFVPIDGAGAGVLGGEGQLVHPPVGQVEGVGAAE